jgi:hypothetical protein
MAVPDQETKVKAEGFLSELISLTRLPQKTGFVVSGADFQQALLQTPRADLAIFGLSREPDLTFVQNLVQIVGGSCVFVRDSGIESALA